MSRLARAAVLLLWTLPGIVNAAAAQSTPPPAATLQAVRLSAPLHIDGQLDEAVYTTVPPISDFIQMEPRAGEAATEKTEVWVFFDEHNVHVTMRAWESRPDLMVANEMRRDSNNIRMGDCVGFSLDTFHDGRARPNWPDVVFAFHDDEEIGPKMMARIAKRTGLTPDDF